MELILLPISISLLLFV